MLVYIARRILLMFPTLLGVTAVVFFVMANAPGGFGAALDNQGTQSEGQDARRLKKAMERRYGIDQPQVVQYGRWLNQVSPVGFRMSHQVTFDADEHARVQEVFQGQAFNNQPIDLQRAVDLTLDIAAYRQEPAEGVASRLAQALATPDKAVELFDWFDAEVDDPQGLVTEIQSRRSAHGLGAAQNRLIEELAFEMSGRSRMLLNQPVVKFPDLGESIRRRPVTELIGESLPQTLLLNVLAFPLIYFIAVVVGVQAAKHRGGLFDVGAGTLLVMLWSLPVIWLGAVCISYFANKEYLYWFPTGQLHDPNADAMAFWPIWDASGFRRGYLLDTLWHLVLPVMCMTFGGFAVLSKVMRGAMLESLASDYVRTARAKGVSERSILWHHVFRNSLLPLITMFAAVLPAMIVGSVIVESIFSIPGMGALSLRAAFATDREVIMAIVLVGALLKLSSEVLRDVCYAIADPRVSYD